MPRKTTAFACSMGCGRNVLTSYKRMAEHEGRCFWNPLTKSCVTCAEFMPRDKDGPEFCSSYQITLDKLRTECSKWKSDEKESSNETIDL